MKLLVILFVFINITFAKQDFYYSFIDKNKIQMNEHKKKMILSSNDRLLYIQGLIRQGQLDEAYNDIVQFRRENKIKILKAPIDILYADILYKLGMTKYAIEGAQVLTDSINSGIITELNLLDALKLLVKLEIRINKIKEAEFYAKAINDSFDDPLSKAYAKIAKAQIYTHQKKYKKAIKILYDILVKTNNMDVATVVADELYDVYILNGDDKKAHELASKVLQKNIEYYANNSYRALKKVNKLLKANMPFLAIKILKKLLENASKSDSINNFKFKLANGYMFIKTTDLKYILKAKELYKDLIRTKEYNKYKKRAKMYLDEILMREGKLTPEIIARKYPDSDVMQEKALLQELLNNAKEHHYKKITKLKRVYKKISKITARRFGYNDIDEIFAIIDSDMIKYYLANNQCLELSKIFKTINLNSLRNLIITNQTNSKMFDCLLEYPDKKTFKIANKAFENSKDGDIYLYLEKMALQLNLFKEAYKISQRFDMIDDKDKNKYKTKEFLYRFLIYGKLNNDFSMDKFFEYALSHKEYIKANENNPMIIDFYYQYYLYLIKKHKTDEAVQILNKLYNTQIDMDAFVYSPFVEMQLSQEAKLDDNYDLALNYLKQALEHPRRIKPDDLVQIYFEMANVYKKLGKENRYKDAIDKCKNVKNTKSIYKTMCERL